MSNLEIFRPRSGILASILGYLIVTILVIQIAVTSEIHGTALAIIWGIFATQLIYMIMHRPKIEIFDEGICIINPMCSLKVGWGQVEDIDSRYTMSIQVGDRTIYAWAAPAPGRHHSRTIHPSDIKGMNIGIDGQIRSGDSPRTHSGAAAYLAALRCRNFQETHPWNEDNFPTAHNKTNRVGISILIVSFTLGIALNYYHF